MKLTGRDVRMAKDITWNSSTKISLVIPNTSGADYVYVYEYLNGSFTRTQTAPTAIAAQTLITGIAPASFSLAGYKISINPATGSPYQVDLTNLNQASLDTKQLQLSLSVRRSVSTGPSTNANVISARYILRNKQVAS